MRHVEPHGGIVRSVTRFLIERAHGRASSYDVSDIGANIVARWQSMHDLYKIGATSLVNVGVPLAAGCGPVAAAPAARTLTAATATILNTRAKRIGLPFAVFAAPTVDEPADSG